MNYKYELFENLKRTAKLQITTLSVIVCCLFILITLLTVQSNLDNIFSAWTKNIRLTAYLDTSLNKEQLESVVQNVKSKDIVESANYVSREQYKEEFDKKLLVAMPKLQMLSSISNPFLDGIEISIKSISNMSSLDKYLEKASALIGEIKGVQEVSYGKVWVSEYTRLSGFISYASIFIILALLASISFIVGNAVKTLLENRRKEIHILSILGATSKSIYIPFYANIAILLFAGFSISLTLSLLFKIFVESLFTQHLSLLGIQIVFPSLFSLTGLFLLILGFAFLGAYFHLVKMAKMRYQYDI